MTPAVRIVALVLAMLVVVLLGYVVWRQVGGDALPDLAAVEQRLAASVAAGDTLASVVARFETEGYTCGETATADGAWHCDLPANGDGGDLDCPMRIMVTLLPDSAGGLARFAVSKGAFCM